MHTEITKELFEWILAGHTHYKLVEGELTRKAHFQKLGVELIEVHHHVSGITQYFVQDINA